MPPGVPALRVAALVKQIPEFEELRLGPDGRLERAGLPLEMSAYCRRAVAQGVLLAAQTGGTCTVITLGPPSAEDVLREAVAFGADRGVLISDEAFAGSDTLATARALAAAIESIERDQGAPFDIVFAGRNSVDADTGQVGPAVAQLLDRAFATGVKELTLDGLTDGRVAVGLEHDDVWVDATVALPAVLSTAERLIDPCKIKDPAVWATVDAARIDTLTAAELGPGPWGQAASPTTVGQTRVEAVERARLRLRGPVEEQVATAVAELADRGVLRSARAARDAGEAQPRDEAGPGPVVAAVIEPDRPGLARELLTGATRLAAELEGSVVALGPAVAADAHVLLGWGADRVVDITGAVPAAIVEEDVAAAIGSWAAGARPWGVLAGSTAWGREVAARVATFLGAGLIGDAVGFAVEHGRLVAWKPAFGGGLVAAIRSSSDVQMATVRQGVLAPVRVRAVAADPLIETLVVHPRGRVVVSGRRREDDVDALMNAEVVIDVGGGVDPQHYGELDELRELLGAEIGATRKVTDKGWLPRARQIGITGHSLAPRLVVAIGTSGKFNHMVGVRSAGTVVAINPDAGAPVFDVSDVGIVGDWREVVPVLTRSLRAAFRGAGAGS